MARMVAISRLPLIGAALLALPGCSMFSHKPMGDPTVVPGTVLREQAHEDRARLAGEDGPGSNSKIIYGVDVGYDDWYYVPFHVTNHLIGHVYDLMTGGETPLKDVGAMEDTHSSDRRREGILKVVGYPFARVNPYVKRYQQISQESATDPGVRAAAIRAMNRSRDKNSIDLYIRFIDNTDPAVRLEAAKAMANIPAEKAVPSLIKHLDAGNEDNKDVRIACADALREYKTLDVSRALINVLGDKDFAVAWQAHESLTFLTGRDFRYEDVAWLRYLSTAKTPFL